MSSRLSRLLAGLMLCLSLSGGANAAEHKQPPLAPPPTAHHLTLRGTFVSGTPDLMGLSLSVVAFRPLDLELGASVGPPAECCVDRRSYFWRLGYRRFVIDVRDPAGIGAVWHFQGMAGYRYLSVRAFDAVGETSTLSAYHGPTLNVSVDAVRWLTRRFGVNAQLTVGGIWYAFREGTEHRALAPDLRFAVGVAL